MVRIPDYERLRQLGLLCWKARWLSRDCAQRPPKHETRKDLDRIYVQLLTKPKNTGIKENPGNITEGSDGGGGVPTCLVESVPSEVVKNPMLKK